MLISNMIVSVKVKYRNVVKNMNNGKEILELAKKNNGIITTAEVVEAGYLRGNLKYLVDSGLLERSSRGVYILPDAWDDEFLSLQVRYKKGIFSLGTALFLLDLTDRTPNKFNMIFPGTYNLSSAKESGILCTGAREPYYSLGIIEIQTPGGHTVRCYNAEKTLCDILQTKNQVNIEIITNAFKLYVSRKDKNINRLSEYAKMLKVADMVRSYIEVLL